MPDERAATSRILLVEDETLIQMLAAEFVEELGFSAEVAGSASAAKSRLADLKGEVAAALVDIGLPDASGDVLVSELRAVYPELPIVVASGHSEAALRERFRDQRAIGFLSKPYSLEQMRSAFRAIGILA
jgi:DNA-binding response OmpR family regulator